MNISTKKTALKALDLMTTNDVAKELSVTIRTVQRWVEQGALVGWKTPGGHRRITRTSFNRFMTAKADNLVKNVAKAKLNIVIVEDDHTIQHLYRMTIASWKLPIEINVMSNGYEGLIEISQNKPDLLITDLNMPKMDGFSLLKAIRNNGDFSQMAIAVVTGLPAYEIKDKGGLPEGVKLYGKAPVPFKEMRELIHGLLKNKQEEFSD